MKAWLAIAAGAVALSAAMPARAATGRVLVAGPPDDPLAWRVIQELVAMGFDAVRSDGADGCTRAAVATRAEVEHAVGAVCSDGTNVVVYSAEKTGLRIRDVVVAQGANGKDTAAVRSAEILRASLELRESEPAPEPAPPPPPAPPTRDESAPPWKPAAAEKAAPPVASPRRTPLFALGAGLGSLMGVDASVATFSGRIDLGVSKTLTLALHAEIPIESAKVNTSDGDAAVSPGFVGAGVSLPILPPSKVVVPRIGAGLGVAWLKGSPISGAPTPQPLPPGFGEQTSPSSIVNKTDTVASVALYADAGLTIRIAGPVRFGVDGLFGSTGSRMVVRSSTGNIAFWGQPFGGLAVRAELVIP